MEKGHRERKRRCDGRIRSTHYLTWEVEIDLETLQLQVNIEGRDI